MVSFKDIIDANGGRLKMHEKLGLPRHTVYSWYVRDRIPAEYWQRMYDAGFTMPTPEYLIQMASGENK